MANMLAFHGQPVGYDSLYHKRLTPALTGVIGVRIKGRSFLVINDRSQKPRETGLRQELTYVVTGRTDGPGRMRSQVIFQPIHIFGGLFRLSQEEPASIYY
jgi:hypothetical protein